MKVFSFLASFIADLLLRQPLSSFGETNTHSSEINVPIHAFYYKPVYTIQHLAICKNGPHARDIHIPERTKQRRRPRRK